MCERRRTTRAGAAAFVALLLSLGAATPASAADVREQARQLFVAGKAHYAAGRYKQAVQAFVRAGKLRPSPILDFNIGRCHERLGHAALAIVAYERYLKGRPKAGNRAQVQANIARLRRLAARKPAADPYEDLEGGGGEGNGDHGGAVTVVPPVAAPAPLGSKAGSNAGSQPTSRAWLRLAPATSGIAMAAPATKSSADADVHAKGAPSTGSSGARGGPAGSSPVKVTGPRPTPDPAQRRYASFGPARRLEGPAGPGKAPLKPPRAPLGPYKPRDEGPIYKQWWFWTAIGVGVLITGFVIGMAASGSDSTNAKSGALLGSPGWGPSRATGLGLSF